MSVNEQARVTAKLEGVDQVAAGADKIGNSLEKAGQKAQSKVGGALKSIATGLGSVVQTGLTAAGVLGALNVANAVSDVRRLDEQTARLGRTAHVSADALKMGFDAAERRTLTSSMAMADFAKNLGRATLNSRGAIEAVGGLGDEALATGQDLNDQLDLGKVLMSGLGATGDLSDELGRLRHQAESLGLAGGPQALKDTLVAIGPALQTVAITSDAARAKLEALVAVSSKGLRPEQQKAVAGGMLGFLKGQATAIRRSSGVDVLDEYGQLKDPTAALALYKSMADRKFGKNERAKKEAIINQAGEDVGRAILRTDIGEVQRTAALGNEGKTAAEAEAARQSKTGKRTAAELAKDQARRTVGEKFLGAQDALVGAVGVPAATVIEGGGGALALKGAIGAGKLAAGSLSGGAPLAGGTALGGAALGAGVGLVMAGQVAAVSSLGQDRDEMGADWRKEHAPTIGRELAQRVISKGEFTDEVFQSAAKDGAVVELLKALNARQAELNETLRTQVTAGLAAELRKNPIQARIVASPNQSQGN